MKLSNPQKGVLFASVTATLWGFLAIILKVTLTLLTPVEVTWFRFTVAFLVLAAYYGLFDKKSLGILTKPPILSVFAAFCLGLNYFGFISGIHLTTPGIAQIFIQLGPVLLALSGFFLFREKITLQQALGLMLVIFGLFVFYHEQIFILAQNGSAYRKGVISVIFGAFMWACYAVLQKKLVQKHHPMQLNLILFGIPALLYLPFVKFSMLTHLPFWEWFLLVLLGLNTLIAYGSLSYAFKYLEAHKISVIITLNPTLTLFIMFLLDYLHASWIQPEKLSPVTLVGAAIVLTGAIFTVSKKLSRQT